MRVTIELRRPSRRFAAVLLGLILLGIPAVALASHQFPDVSNGHPFHADIDAIVDAGIATGFQDGTYRPSDPVTRQAMAAFMHRGFGRVGLQVGDAPMTSTLSVAQGAFNTTNAWIPVRSITITAPGQNSNVAPYQYALLHGVVVLGGKMDAALQGCPCQFSARIHDIDSNAYSWSSTDTFVSYNSVSAGFGWSFTVDTMMAVGPGPRTYQIEIALGYRDSAANATSWSVSQITSLSAMTVPFGRNGTNAP